VELVVGPDPLEGRVEVVVLPVLPPLHDPFLESMRVRTNEARSDFEYGEKRNEKQANAYGDGEI
jgi:hypothetical protein